MSIVILWLAVSLWRHEFDPGLAEVYIMNQPFSLLSASTMDQSNRHLNNLSKLNCQSHQFMYMAGKCFDKSLKPKKK